MPAMKLPEDMLDGQPYTEPLFIGHVKKREYWVYHAKDVNGLDLAENYRNENWSRYSGEMILTWGYWFAVVKHRNGINVEDVYSEPSIAKRVTAARVLAKENGVLAGNAHASVPESVPIAIDTVVASFVSDFDRASTKKKMRMLDEVERAISSIEILKEKRDRFMKKQFKEFL